MQLLSAMDRSDPDAARLLPLVDDELRRLAAARFAAEPQRPLPLFSRVAKSVPL
jgi:hypothetical protein